MDRLIFPQNGNKRIYDCLILILFAAIITVKFQDLYLPFFWDEMGVYGLGVAYQYNHILSLMPNSVPAHYSHGHPLMFTFINACAWRVFGNTMFIAHAFILLVSLTLVFIIYKKISYYFNPLAGMVSAAFLSVQPLFMGQACLVLPEITLTFFALLSLTSYFERKYFQYTLFASCAILTKESAVVLPATCLAFSLLQVIMYRKFPDGLKIRNLLLTFVPYGIFGIFLMLQKSQYGWYFFPYHIESMQYGLQGLISRFSAFFDSVFWSQGRYWSEKLLLISLVVSVFKNQLNYSNFGKSFLTLVGIFMLAFLCFSSVSVFFMDRYVFAVVTGTAILAGPALTAITRNKWIVFPVTLFLSLVACRHWENPAFQYDSNLDYRRSVHTVQQAINYTASVAGKGETVWGPWPTFFAIRYPEDGYLNPPQIKTTSRVNDSTSYYIYNSPGDVGLPDPQKFRIKQLAEFRDGFAVSRVYRIQAIKNQEP